MLPQQAVGITPDAIFIQKTIQRQDSSKELSQKEMGEIVLSAYQEEEEKIIKLMQNVLEDFFLVAKEQEIEEKSVAAK